MFFLVSICGHFTPLLTRLGRSSPACSETYWIVNRDTKRARISHKVGSQRAPQQFRNQNEIPLVFFRTGYKFIDGLYRVQRHRGLKFRHQILRPTPTEEKSLFKSFRNWKCSTDTRTICVSTGCHQYVKSINVIPNDVFLPNSENRI